MEQGSNRQTILAVLLERLREIRRANTWTWTPASGAPVTGRYQTDAGASVFLGEAPGALGQDDAEVVLSLVVGDDSGAEFQREQVLTTLSVEVQIVALLARPDCWEAIEAVIADVKHAIERDRRLGLVTVSHQVGRGVTRTLPRQEGSNVVGAGITYDVSYTEIWGHP